MLIAVIALLPPFLLGQAPAAEERPRARDLGIAPGVFEPGPWNAITDVAGVTVGQVTRIEGDSIRTGVTVIRPHGDNLFQKKVPAAVYVGNAFGKLAGSTQVEELGTLESPVVLTNTLAVGTAVDAVVRWSLRQPGNEKVRSVNALVGETNDGGLNDIRSLPITTDDVLTAIDSAQSGPVHEGCVGAGTGCEAFGWKGGIGTSSRRLPDRYGGYTVGVLVQANYGGVLTMGGADVGKALGRHAYQERTGPRPAGNPGDGSCMIVVATDAPAGGAALKRMAARSIFAMARTGSSFSNGSGDYAIAFSTHPSLVTAHGAAGVLTQTTLPNDGLSPLFQATLEATEEALDNALLKATTMTGKGGRTVEALPIDRLKELLPPRR